MDTNENYEELWDYILREQEAELDELDAEKRMERINVLEEMKKQFDATTDWTEAKWKQFIARLSR